MQHCDDDVLALVALGEQPSPADAEHLTRCSSCRAEVESFGRVVAAGRPALVAGPDVAPPDRVWQSVAAATGVTARPRTIPAPAGPQSPDGPNVRRMPPPPPSVPSAPADDDDRPAPGVVTALRPRPAGRARRRFLPFVAVAASALVVGGAVGSGITMMLDRDPAPVVQVIAQTRLDPLPADPSARGTAVVVDADGTRKLEVDVSTLAGVGDGFYEVWLIDASVEKMVPIGILSGARGEFTIPAGLDLGQYPVVDISAEPLDGDPTHSGTSLLRGTISL